VFVEGWGACAMAQWPVQVCHELNKTAKLKGVNIDTVLTLISITHVSQCVGIVWLEFAKIEGAEIFLHVKSPTFRAAKLKGFTVTCFIRGSVGSSHHSRCQLTELSHVYIGDVTY